MVELTLYQLFMIALALVIQAGGFTAWLMKIKNDMNTRIAVLEASHSIVTETLKEIRLDVKELLRSVAS